MVNTESFDFSLRPLVESDLPWFTSLRSSAREFLHDQRDFSLEDVRVWWSATKPDFRVVVDKGSAIGYLRIGVLEQTNLGTSLWIGADLAEDRRGLGLGKAMYDWALPVLKDEFGNDGFKLRVLPTNTRAIRLYLSLGFKITAATTDNQMEERVIRITDLEMSLHPKISHHMVSLDQLLAPSLGYLSRKTR